MSFEMVPVAAVPAAALGLENLEEEQTPVASPLGATAALPGHTSRFWAAPRGRGCSWDVAWHGGHCCITASLAVGSSSSCRIAGLSASAFLLPSPLSWWETS